MDVCFSWFVRCDVWVGRCEVVDDDDDGARKLTGMNERTNEATLNSLSLRTKKENFDWTLEKEGHA